MDDEVVQVTTRSHMTIEQAAQEYGEEAAAQSLEKEFCQYVEKLTLRGVPKEEFIEPDRIIPFKTFVKEKKDADGNFQSLKTDKRSR